MGAFSKVAEENHGDAEGWAELKRFAHICQLGPWIQSLVKLVHTQIRRRALNVKEKEERNVKEEEEEERNVKEEEERRKLEEERHELVEGLATELYLATKTRKEDEVFRKEVIRQMVKIIEDAIESVPVPGNGRRQLMLLRLNGVIKQKIYSVASKISKTRWMRTEEGKVVPLEREYQTAADHEVVKLKEELEEADRRLKASDKEHGDLLKQCAELKKEKENKEKQYAELVKELVEELAKVNRASDKEHEDLLKEKESKEKRCAELEEENSHLKTSLQRGDSPEDGDLVAKLKEELEEANIASHKRYAELKEENARLKKENESKEKQCAKLEEENIASHKKHDDLSKRCAELEEEKENKEKQYAVLVEGLFEERAEVNRASDKKHEDLLKENESKKKRCAELEEENRHLKTSRQRGDSPEDGDLADSNAVLQVVSQVPEEGAAVNQEREETSTTAAPTGAKRSATTKKRKQEIDLSEPATSSAVGILVGFFISHLENQSAKTQTSDFVALKFCILATFICGLSIFLLTTYSFKASYQKPIIKVLFYETKVLLGLSGVFVCIPFMKAIYFLAFVPVIFGVIVGVIVVCIKEYNKTSKGTTRR